MPPTAYDGATIEGTDTRLVPRMRARKRDEAARGGGESGESESCGGERGRASDAERVSGGHLGRRFWCDQALWIGGEGCPASSRTMDWDFASALKGREEWRREEEETRWRERIRV